MQVFDRKTTDYIAEQLYLYFDRKRLSIREAKALIDYVQGTAAPTPSSSMTLDYAKPRVLGGGGKRPSEKYISRIINRAEEDQEWDKVFGELICKYKSEPETEKFIKLTFQKKAKEEIICEIMHISRVTFYRYRATILSRAAVIAIKNKMIEV